jgi:lysophospholipase L1-like esterase
MDPIRKTPLKNLALVIGSFLLSLFTLALILEVAFRWEVPSSPWFFVHPPGKVARYQPLPGSMPGMEGESIFKINFQGVRGNALTEEKKQYRILSIGGSTTECNYLDERETWSALLQENLGRTKDGREVWVGNVGKSGLRSRDHRVQIKYLLPQFPRIDVVLVLVGVNDMSIHIAQGKDYSPDPLWSLKVEKTHIRRAFDRVPDSFIQQVGPLVPGIAWYQKSLVYQAIMERKSFINWKLMTWGLRHYEGGGEYIGLREKRQEATPYIEERPDLNLPLEDYSRNLHSLVDLAHSNGAQLVFMTQPSLWQRDLGQEEQKWLWFGGMGNFLNERGKPYYSVEVLTWAMDRYNKKLMEVCEIRRIACINLADQMPSKLEFFFDDVHFTENGAKRVAEVATSFFKNRPPFL